MAATPASPNRPFALALSIISIVGLVAVLFILLLNLFSLPPLTLWGILALSITLLLLGLGLGANNKWYGVLIDSRNRTSLSRLQMTLWTIMAISAFLAMALPRSMPDALTKEREAAIVKCRADYVFEYAKTNNITGVRTLEELRAKDADAALVAETEAAGKCVLDPLNITFPEELLLALGISTASFAGSSLIQSNKRNRPGIALIGDHKKKIEAAEKLVTDAENKYKGLVNQVGAANASLAEANVALQTPEPAPEDKAKWETQQKEAQQKIEGLAPSLEQATTALEASKKSVEDLKKEFTDLEEKSEGLLKINQTPQEATLGDMFQGDEIGDYDLIDLSKVQMFFFTIAILVAYGTALAGIFRDTGTLMRPLGVDFPAFSASLNTLLAISHAGYLTVKSVSHTQTTPSGS